MSDQNHAIRDDIAFLRSLAEEGRSGSMVGGSILVLFGGLYAAASVFTWYAIQTGLARKPLFFPIVWFGATLVALAALAFMKVGQPRKGGASRAAGLAWAAAGWTIFAIMMSFTLIGYHTGSWMVMQAVAPVIVSIYGGAWFLAAQVTGQRWLNLVAFGSFVMAAVNAWFVADPATMFLIYAATLLGLLAGPGLVIMRQGRKAA